jgi:Tfp pilus assembly protein PilN
MKTLRKKQPPPSPPWHPDFRDAAALPDVKVIRTSFFVNGFAGLALLLIAVLVGYQEMRHAELRNGIQEIQEKVAANRTRNSEVLQLQREYQPHERFISEVAAFLDDSFELSRFMATLANSIPPEMTVTNMRYQDTSGGRGQAPVRQLHVNGAIRGTPDAAASIVTEYVALFQSEPVFMEKVERAVPNSLVPTTEGNVMAFGIQLTLKSANTTAAAGTTPANGRTNR